MRKLSPLLWFALALPVFAQSDGAFFSFTSGPGGDGFQWPRSPGFGGSGLLPDQSFTLPTNNSILADIRNDIGNNLFFDSQYQAAGNSGFITGDAMWGNPKPNAPSASGGIPISGIYLDGPGIQLSGSTIGNYSSTPLFSFDASLAIAGQHAPTSVQLIGGLSVSNVGFGASGFLSNTFQAGQVFGGFNGSAGRVNYYIDDFFPSYSGFFAEIDSGTLFDQEQSSFDREDFQQHFLDDWDNGVVDSDYMIDFGSFALSFNNVATPGGLGEFAVDNLSFLGSEDLAGVNLTTQETVEAGTDFANNTVELYAPVSSAAIIGGSTTVQQTITLSYIDDPQPTGFSTTALVSDSYELTFSDTDENGFVDNFVLEIAYDDGAMGPGTEGLVRLLFFSDETGDWELAIDGNSDGGAGAFFFEGTYSEYLESLGGGEAALSAHGLDTATNVVWAVLDHATPFGAGDLQGIPEPGSLVLLTAGVIPFFRRRR